MNSQLSKTLDIKSNYSLQTLNTLAVPAAAEFFTLVKTEDQFDSLLEFIKEQQCHLSILGGGSNVLLPRKMPGLLAKIETKAKTIIAETADDITLRFSAGEEWHSVVMWCVQNGYCGIENLALIPGSVGAAPIQNIGAYGVELESCCESVEAIVIASGKRIRLSRAECQFAYRDSIFKNELKDKTIITHVTLKLKKYISGNTDNLNITYPALKAELEKNDSGEGSISPMDVAAAVIKIRQSKLPDPKDIPNAGSFFKNPVVSKSTMEKIKSEHPDLVAYPLEQEQFKLAAGWLLDKAGWKGKDVDGIAMHSQQALVLTNPQRMSSEELLKFSALVRQSISQLFAVDLEIEPRVF